VTDQKPRQIAARVLAQRRADGEYTEVLLDRALAGTRLSTADRGLCQELVYGVVRSQSALDWLIERKTPGRTQKAALQILLRLGLYQSFWLDRIPDHAAVNETVEQARHGGHGPQTGFINAMLRGYLREKETTQALLAELETKNPALGFSHPEWLVQRWQRHWGEDNARRLLKWNNTPPKTFARVNTLRADAGKLVARWREENVDYDFFQAGRGAAGVSSGDWVGENLVFELKSHPPLAWLDSFQQGGFYIQDPSTLLAARELDPQPGEAVLDLCAAPGGKATFIAQLMNNSGRIIANDVSPDRLRLIEENCKRLGVACVELTSPSPMNCEPSSMDRVLVDVPCSNTGVMRRRVDLRWRIRPEEIERLCATQLELLDRAAAWLKPGGILVYSTCSLEPEENAGVVQQFLAAHPSFRSDRERQLLPFADGVDGAFVARLVKGK